MPKKAPTARSGGRGPKKRKVKDRAATIAPVRSMPSPLGGAPEAPRSLPTERMTKARQPAPSFTADYRYVTSDLKRIALISGGIFVLLVILAVLFRSGIA